MTELESLVDERKSTHLLHRYAQALDGRNAEMLRRFQERRVVSKPEVAKP